MEEGSGKLGWVEPVQLVLTAACSVTHKCRSKEYGRHPVVPLVGLEVLHGSADFADNSQFLAHLTHHGLLRRLAREQSAARQKAAAGGPYHRNTAPAPRTTA